MKPFIERHLNILDFTLSSLMRRKGKNIALLAIYLLVVFILASLVFFITALKHEASMILKHAPDIVVQKMIAGRHDLIPLSHAVEIGEIKGVKKAAPRYWGYYYDQVYEANYTLMVSGNPALPREEIIVGPGVHRAKRVEKGDFFTLMNNNVPIFLKVQDILDTSSELAAADMILMSRDDFTKLFDFPIDRATDIAVTVANPLETGTVAKKIIELLPGTRPILKSEIQRTYQSIFDWRGGMILVVLTSVLLSFIIFAWDKATGLSAEERKEIGILKSVGWETSDVLLFKVWEGVVISLTAFLVGTVLAYCYVFFLSAPLFASALKGWSVIYPNFKLVPVVDLYQLFVLFFLSVVPYTVATVIPCWRAAIADPDAAMRS